jgi:hypothetical protein
MDLFFPIAVAILLLLFLVTNFEWIATVLSYIVIISLILLVMAAIGYGLYDKLGAEASILLGIVAVGVLGMTKIGYSIAGFIKGFIEGYRAGPARKA